LLEVGQASARELSKQTKLPQLDVHNALRELLKIGIVQEATTNKPSFLVTQQTRQKENKG
jgi:sugar-specific transcriptional regulator TrmB